MLNRLNPSTISLTRFLPPRNLNDFCTPEVEQLDGVEPQVVDRGWNASVP